MDNDRELLALAAKAAGIECDQEGPRVNGEDGFFLRPWNPLTNDGDALRLAVSLSIYVGPRTADVWTDGRETYNVFVDEDDQLTATRRAIVIAAAEFGRRL